MTHALSHLLTDAAMPACRACPCADAADSLAKIGSFTTRCLMGANAEACASPLCDGATIVITGEPARPLGRPARLQAGVLPATRVPACPPVAAAVAAQPQVTPTT
jgi:hypothetical protein